MKTETTNRAVESYGVEKEAFFTIEEQNTAHIFGILRNQLYSNKPLAVIREYSTNAYDAHIEAGHPDEPIEVTLPTILNPVFKVRDYGVGLSEDGVMRVFASYGMSTKRDDNTQVGMLGLGSKSAFCYGNAYEITSYYNGTRTLFTAYLDETNKGKIAKTLEEPTTERNGIEISVAIRKEDISTFVFTAKTFFTHFSPRPVFKGVVNEINEHLDTMHKATPFKEGATWKMMGTVNRVQSVVVMGNVSYPLNGSIFNQSADYNYQTLVNNGGLILRAGIGDVMITASREALEYNDKTKKWIRAQIDAIVKQVEHDLQQEMNTAANLWTARMLYNKIRNQASWFVNMFPVKLTFRGKQIAEPYVAAQTVEREFIKGMGIGFKTYDNWHKSRLKSGEVKTLTPKDDMLFVLNKNNGAFPRSEITARIRGAHKAHTSATIVVVHFDLGDKSADFESHPEIEGARCVDLATFAPHKITSTGQSTTINYDRRKCKVFSLDRKKAGNYVGANSEAWEMEPDADLDNDRGVFIYINSFAPAGVEAKWLSYNVSLTEFSRVLNEAQAAGITIPPIFGIRDSVERDKIGKNWIPLGEYLKAEAEKSIVKNKLGEALNRSEQLQAVPTHYMALVGMLPQLPAGKLADFVTRMNSLRDDKQHSMVVSLQAFIRRVSLAVTIPNTQKVDLTAEREAVEREYPMLRAMLQHIGTHYLCNAYKAEFLHYLKMVEAEKVSTAHNRSHAHAVIPTVQLAACTV